MKVIRSQIVRIKLLPIVRNLVGSLHGFVNLPVLPFLYCFVIRRHLLIQLQQIIKCHYILEFFFQESHCVFPPAKALFELCHCFSQLICAALQLPDFRLGPVLLESVLHSVNADN